MRKIYVLFLSILVVLTTTAQVTKVKHKTIPPYAENGNFQFPPSLQAAGCDTLLWSPTTISQYGASAYYADRAQPRDSGFMSGLNAYDDKQKGNYFNVSGSANSNYVTKVRFAIGLAKSNDMSKTIFFRVYDVSGTGITLAGSSSPIPLSDLTGAIGGIADYTFPTPIPLSTKQFIISVDFSNLSFTANDSFFVYQNNYTTSLNAPDSAVEQLSTGDWVGMSGTWRLPPTFVYLFPYVSSNNTCTLPVTFGDFTAKVAQAGVVINWQTWSEKNNLHFEVERSTDALKFSAIGTVLTKAVNGNSQGQINYQFTDVNPAQGANYYRIRQIDKDGSSEYSKLVKVSYNIQENNSIVRNYYPNPVSDRLFIQLGAGIRQVEAVRITDASGKILSAQKPAVSPDGIINVSTKALRSGLNFATVILPDGKQSTIKVMKD